MRQHIAQEALKIGNGELAIQQYTYLMELENADFSTFEGFVATSLALKQAEQAEVAAAKAIKRWPEKGRAFELLGNAALASGKEDEAKKAFTKAIELDPFLLDAKEKLESL